MPSEKGLRTELEHCLAVHYPALLQDFCGPYQLEGVKIAQL